MKHMNAKVEATELYNKFYNTSSHPHHVESRQQFAKQCALIAVDVILDFIKWNYIPYTYDKDSMEAVISNKQHYIKVKNEIEKL